MAGAVAANATGQLIATVWVFVALARRHDYRLPGYDLVKIAAAAILAFVIARLIAGSGVGFGSLVLGAMGGSVVFILTGVLTRVVGPGEWVALWSRLGGQRGGCNDYTTGRWPLA